ncbi:MAG: hypothetical protein LBI91_05385, partial [Spirochaetaceae bacterium]|nr:hypothetical protein [Spirochaetaceae bacterium]
AILESADRLLLDQAAALKNSAGESGRRAEKLKASLAIDEEKAGIGKMERQIADHRRRIAENEKDIQELGSRIEEAKKRIEGLSRV